MNKLLTSVAVAVTIATTTAGGAQATELLTNGSFEAPAIGGGNYTYPSGLLASWTYAGSALVGATGSNAWYGGSPPPGQDGAQFAALQGTSTLSQAFTSTGGSAKLSWIAAGRPFFGGYNGDQTYNVLVGSTVVGTFSTVSGQAFGSYMINLTGLTAGAHVLTFAGQIAADETSFIDQVSITAVPEPATWGMLLVGFAMVGMAARRRKVLTAA